MPMLKSKQKRRSSSKPFEIKVTLGDDRVSYGCRSQFKLDASGVISTRIYKGDEVAEMMPENKTKKPTWKRLATY